MYESRSDFFTPKCIIIMESLHRSEVQFQWTRWRKLDYRLIMSFVSMTKRWSQQSMSKDALKKLRLWHAERYFDVWPANGREKWKLNMNKFWLLMWSSMVNCCEKWKNQCKICFWLVFTYIIVQTNKICLSAWNFNFWVIRMNGRMDEITERLFFKCICETVIKSNINSEFRFYQTRLWRNSAFKITNFQFILFFALYLAKFCI